MDRENRMLTAVSPACRHPSREQRGSVVLGRGETTKLKRKENGPQDGENDGVETATREIYVPLETQLFLGRPKVVNETL